MLSCCFLTVFNAAGAVSASEDRLTIYIDADYSIMPAPAEAIEIGLRSAFAGTWAEHEIAIIPKNHRTNARRSLDTFQQAFHDPSAIAVIGGMHSPPYFVNGAQINELAVPLLLPWSAGGMLTRLSEGDDNWIFRLSVDDTKAAETLVRHGSSVGCSKASLIYVDNPWGNTNASRISEEIDANNARVVSLHPLDFNAGEQSVIEVVNAIDPAATDCVYLITSLVLGKSAINALGDFENPPRVISHWGILGDRLTDYISYEVIQKVRLSILGTCGLQEARNHPQVYDRARDMARKTSGRDFDPELHAAPHGFFHAHDLGLLLMQAIEAARQTEAWQDGGPVARRLAVRDALYTLNQPTEGLLKVYALPFAPVSAGTFDGHEALGSDDLCMTKVDDLGHIASLDIR